MNPANPTNAYTVPSVSIATARTGASAKANELGMRAMQERAYAKRGEQYLLIKSPPASGKSRALMFIALDKLQAPLFSEDSNVMSSATVLGPKAGLRSSMLTISVSDLVDCWENKGEIFVWAYIQYRDIFESTKVHHHQQCAKLALIHEPTTAPPDGHPPYLQFMSFGAQNTAS